MQNASGRIVDLYVPRKCSVTNRLISAKDHASVQINVARVDPDTGRAIPGEHLTIALTGSLRRMGLSDQAVHKLVKERGALSDLQSGVSGVTGAVE
jgi:small subunit ribosomal protein S21e